MLKALRPRLELQTKKVSSSPPGPAPILRDPEISETGGKANRFRALLPRLLCERPIRCFRRLGDEGQADHIDQGKQRDRQGEPRGGRKCADQGRAGCAQFWRRFGGRIRHKRDGGIFWANGGDLSSALLAKLCA